MISFDSLMLQVEPEQRKNLHVKGFQDTSVVISNFIDTCRNNFYEVDEQDSNIHWVCNSAPGHGKTTALQAILKSLINIDDKKTTLLLVFNNNDTMHSFYKPIMLYCKNLNKHNVIEYIDTENIDFFLDHMEEYQFVCITQQRLRDIAMGFGNPQNYLWYKSKSGKKYKRNIIIDEIPEFNNECEFDIASKDNSIDWFDAMTQESKLEDQEIRFVRSLIMKMINRELGDNITQTTKRLMRSSEGTQDEHDLDTYLAKLKPERVKREHQLKYKWFIKLLRNDDVGVIDQTRYGTKILCSERIDYRNLGNILILDGTSSYTKLLYNDEYEFIDIKNYHDYSKRLQIHLREINTSVQATTNSGSKIFELIMDDINAIRSSDINPFPLMAKRSINICLSNGIIDDGQKKYFKTADIEGDELPLNLLNTVGKNKLNEYDSLALLNLPIRNPSHYKKLAISLFGNKVDLTMNTGKSKSWFNDTNVQKLCEQIMLGDLIQIIHRCGLRNIKERSISHIYLYTKRLEWIDKLQEALSLPDENIDRLTLQDAYLSKFYEKCETWAIISREYAIEHDEMFTTPFFYASDIGGRPYKDWLNDNWKDCKRKNIVLDCFKKHGLLIEENDKHYKKIGLM